MTAIIILVQNIFCPNKVHVKKYVHVKARTVNKDLFKRGGGWGVDSGLKKKKVQRILYV